MNWSPERPSPAPLPTRAGVAGPRAGRALAGALLLLSLGGCRAERVLRITSVPPGANVMLDGIELGETPIDHPFIHYGTRRVTLRLPGYLTASEVIEMRPPWYGRFPLDLVSEVLVPTGWRDEHLLHVELQPGRSTIERPDLRSVLDRADALRTAGPEGPRAGRRTPAPANEP